jgi:hypothetical protein
MDNKLMFSSDDNEHYTPIPLLFSCVDFYGGMIDLDPCSNSRVLPNTPALMHYTQAEDGLKQNWWGRVFVNPPYGNALKEWSQKARNEYTSGNCSEVLFLAPSRTETGWYRELIGFDRLNFNSRLKFQNPKNNGNSAPFPSVMFYLGKRHQAFTDTFTPWGEVLRPQAPSRKEYMRQYMQQRRANSTRST